MGRSVDYSMSNWQSSNWHGTNGTSMSVSATLFCGADFQYKKQETTNGEQM